MAHYYPQAVCTLKVRWEDFGNSGDTILQQDYELRVLARDLSVVINDYTRADTFSATFDYTAFPFDPRTIRALGITIHIEDKRKNFITNRNSPNFNAANLIEPTPENTIFQGFADEESIDFDDTNRTISLEGRDFTALLIDAPYTGKAIDMGSPIDVIFKQLVDQQEATRDLTIENRTGQTLPPLSSFYPDFNPLGTSRSSKKKEKYWDVITDIAGRAGLIAFIELDKLVIASPRNVYSDNQPYQFVYGRNLDSLSFKRKLGRQKGINILVRSLNIERKEVLEVKIPEEANADWASALGIGVERQKIQRVNKDGEVKEEDAPFMSFNVPNISNINQLKEVGQGIYEEIGRQQIEGEFDTREMCILQDDGAEFDILKIRNGTPVRIEIDQGDLQGIRRISSEAAREAFLKKRCYAPKVARALARTMGKFDTKFYTREVQFMMGDNGFSMKLGFVNFIDTSNTILGR